MANEKRLIDANALLAKIKNSTASKAVKAVACVFVNDAPTADAVEVVRCKDCKHFVSPQGVPCCDNFMGLGFPNADGSDFCSYGERREGK